MLSRYASAERPNQRTLADTGSDEHKKEFETYYANFDKPNGWRVAERMREIANDVAGQLDCQNAGTDNIGSELR